MLEAADCPIVQIMEIGPNPVDMMIGFSHYEAARAAIAHLFGQGHRKVGFVGARMDPRVQRRLDGYVSAMKDASLFEQRLVVTTATPTSVTLGGALFTDLLAREPDLDAVFCANDDLALGVLFECRRREIAVPEQIAIVGFNDLEFMASAVPTLTSVRTNRYEMGRTAATMLIEAIDGRRPEQPVLDLGFKVIERQSSSARRSDSRPAASGAGTANKMVALPSSHD
jgi:LacI family gluconate utilization system Gnt-I transcriptional repressor